MSELNSVKVSIGNRTYPLRVSKEEEEKVLQAAQAINKRLKEFEDSYAVKDKQDLLAMCALQFATEAMGQHKQDKKAGQNEPAEQVERLKLLIDEYLATEETAAT
jgi:cell division protein ZapA (FtsZ GTPase activity inhibitor)